MVYSFQGAEPAALPHRIRLSDGSTRTDARTFTPVELTDAGYNGPYDRPSCDSLTETVTWDGTSFSVRPFSPAEIDAQWMLVRQQRNALLEASDWTQIEDYDLCAARAAWATYRQELRDITTQANPLDLNWPQSPA